MKVTQAEKRKTGYHIEVEVNPGQKEIFDWGLDMSEEAIIREIRLLLNAKYDPGMLPQKLAVEGQEL